MEKSKLVKTFCMRSRIIKLFFMVIALSEVLFCCYAACEIRYWQRREESIMSRYREVNIIQENYLRRNPEHLKTIVDNVI